MPWNSAGRRCTVAPLRIKEGRPMRAVTIMLLGLLLATTAASCILLAKPAYEKVKDRVSDEDKNE